MIHNNEFTNRVAQTLRSIGGNKCNTAAETLEKEESADISLHLRDLDLEAADIVAIADTLATLTIEEASSLRSVSFSYNKTLGDLGASALAKVLPPILSELGLVNCGIGDLGGNELLKWARNSPGLQMICIEQNNFSENLKTEFLQLRMWNPNLVVVV